VIHSSYGRVRGFGAGSSTQERGMSEIKDTAAHESREVARGRSAATPFAAVGGVALVVWAVAAVVIAIALVLWLVL
jgi:hypothetical protein